MPTSSPTSVRRPRSTWRRSPACSPASSRTRIRRDADLPGLFRAVHTLKGAAYTVGCEPIGPGRAPGRGRPRRGARAAAALVTRRRGHAVPGDRRHEGPARDCRRAGRRLRHGGGGRRPGAGVDAAGRGAAGIPGAAGRRGAPGRDPRDRRRSGRRRVTASTGHRGAGTSRARGDQRAGGAADGPGDHPRQRRATRQPHEPGGRARDRAQPPRPPLPPARASRRAPRCEPRPDGPAVRDFEGKYLNPHIRFASDDPGAGTRPGAPGGDGFAPVSELFAELEFDRYDDFNILARTIGELSADLGEIQAELAATIRSIDEDTRHVQRLTAGLRGEITRARMVPDREAVRAVSAPRPRARRARREGGSTRGGGRSRGGGQRDHRADRGPAAAPDPERGRPRHRAGGRARGPGQAAARAASP